MRIFYVVLKILSLLFTFAGAIMTFMYESIGKFSNQLGVSETQVQFYGLIIFVFSVIIFMSLSATQDVIKEISRPRIKAINKPTWEFKGFTGGKKIDALYVEFENFGQEAALYVSATVAWKNSRGDLINKNHGRWHITNRQIEKGHPLVYVDMLPNNISHKLHFGMKSSDGKTMYAWYRVKDEHGEAFELPEKLYNVEITLKDSHGQSWKFNHVIENKYEKKPKKESSKVKKINKVSPISVNSSSYEM